MDEAAVCGLAVNSVKTNDYFGYLCIPASETMLHQENVNYRLISPSMTALLIDNEWLEELITAINC